LKKVERRGKKREGKGGMSKRLEKGVKGKNRKRERR
jgi:hypothetical protein